MPAIAKEDDSWEDRWSTRSKNQIIRMLSSYSLSGLGHFLIQTCQAPRSCDPLSHLRQPHVPICEGCHGDSRDCQHTNNLLWGNNPLLTHGRRIDIEIRISSPSCYLPILSFLDPSLRYPFHYPLLTFVFHPRLLLLWLCFGDESTSLRRLTQPSLGFPLFVPGLAVCLRDPWCPLRLVRRLSSPGVESCPLLRLVT